MIVCVPLFGKEGLGEIVLKKLFVKSPLLPLFQRGNLEMLRFNGKKFIFLSVIIAILLEQANREGVITKHMGIRSSINRIEKLDKQYMWHPFTQMKEWTEEKPLIITEGRGSFLKDMSGKWYIDGVSSIWVTVHGHRRQEIDDAIKEQVDKVSHSTLLGQTHPAAAALAEMLIHISPEGLSRVFYSDNGSTAVEIGLKMAFQYWQHKGVKGKTKFLTLNNAYHGDTIGAVSVGGIDLFHDIFSPLLFESLKAPSPYCYRCELGKKHPSCKLACLKKAEALIKKHHKTIAAFIVEPLVQGAAGIITAPSGYLKGIRRLCNKYNLLLITDEVATGLGRTGKMFACDHENVSPDILKFKGNKNKLSKQ